MEASVTYILLVLVGLCLGSFAGAMVWRLRARQLAYDQAHNEQYDHVEYNRLKKLIDTPTTQDRSRCLHCSYVLRWYDLIPLVSWLTLRGKCRNCHKPIGYLEPLIELGVALFFVLSYAFWPYNLETGIEIARLVVWLAAGVSLAVLFAYDAKWLLLPDRVNFLFIGLGLIMSTLAVVQADNTWGAIASVAASAAILSGLYFALYLISKGKWVGFGDIKLGLGLALLIADWRIAFIALFAANFVGTLVVLPQLLRGRIQRNTHVPFGPLLIIGAIIAQLVGFYLVDIYMYGLPV